MKLYIETSVPNMLLHEDAPDLQRMTKEFYDWARVCADEFYTSVIAEVEIAGAPAGHRERLLEALRLLNPQLLSITAEARGLAKLYLREGILPPKFSDDAMHVAVAVCHRMDVIVSWNMTHLANVRRVERMNRLHLRYGMPSIRIHTPAEVMES